MKLNKKYNKINKANNDSQLKHCDTKFIEIEKFPHRPTIEVSRWNLDEVSKLIDSSPLYLK